METKQEHAVGESCRWLWIWLAAVLCLIYAGDLGRGFIKDDFGWVLSNVYRSWGDLWSPLSRTSGFFRPVVSWSFGLNYLLAGTNPFWYGLTNFALLFGSAWLMTRFVRHFGYGCATALTAAALWTLNFHGINMALLWLSGRTALLLVFFCVWSLTAFASRRPLLAGVLYFLALLAKEEAVTFALVIFVWLGITVAQGARTWRRVLLRDALCVLVPLIAYLLLRLQSDAFSPATAPDFYRFRLDVGTVLENGAQYADRAATLGVGMMVLGSLVAWRWPVFDRSDRLFLAGAAAWSVLAFGITIFLPVRSSLYACLPSMGVAMGAAVWLTRTWQMAAPRRQRVLITAGLVLPFLLLPVYWARNQRWVRLGQLSSLTLAEIGRRAPPGQQATIVLADDRGSRVNFDAAFGALLPEAGRLFFGDRLTLWMDPPAIGSDDSPAPGDAAVRIELKDIAAGLPSARGLTSW